ncbi:MAG: hypothetical protein HY902_03500 [Deltaproteobacteria bacterium]|nr:hypothetical protein [Deltaproteobacteria bacterium]
MRDVSMRVSRRRFAAQIAAACGVAWLAVPVQAQSPTDQASFEVRIIEGQRAAAPKNDPRLADLQRELAALQQGYNSFSLLSAQTLRLTANQRATVKLPDGADLAIQLLAVVAGPPMRVRHVFELPKSKTIRAVAPGGRTLDVRNGADRLIIICTTVQR